MRLADDVGDATVTDVEVSPVEVCFRLSDGRTVSAPIAWYPRLAAGTDEERSDWRINGAGGGVHWPRLDEDVSAENVLRGQPSMESAKSLERWLAGRGAAAPC